MTWHFALAVYSDDPAVMSTSTPQVEPEVLPIAPAFETKHLLGASLVIAVLGILRTCSFYVSQVYLNGWRTIHSQCWRSSQEENSSQEEGICYLLAPQTAERQLFSAQYVSIHAQAFYSSWPLAFDLLG
jgi:hypothetical protein